MLSCLNDTNFFTSPFPEWVTFNWQELVHHNLICTGITGKLIEETIPEKCLEYGVVPPTVTKLKSAPLGGDQQLGALILEGNVGMLIFFWDPIQPQPHDVDVKALLRIAVLYNIPTASKKMGNNRKPGKSGFKLHA